ncbi:hypothetical protein PR202_gb22150 [Eleusine coracana subsp. coracana]|uniref:Nucleolus and neural progenitor protein-like N-terminal domain-containing protein n=1 Tax=Eleusine coracana subsp. coracana TaxID=191504 RepID=A0AAV5FCU0_ELECO|nr:hypothetical protein PR202_gb22150 [Eleusine coracana subsp. coracana]
MLARPARSPTSAASPPPPRTTPASSPTTSGRRARRRPPCPVSSFSVAASHFPRAPRPASSSSAAAASHFPRVHRARPRRPPPPPPTSPAQPLRFLRRAVSPARRAQPPRRSHAPPSNATRPPMSEEGEENRLRAALRHLQAEAGVLERLVYKHRNQHRGAAYFQYLVKVRRDLKLLLGAGLADVINAVFPVLASRKPVNTILAPTKLIKKKPGTNHSHYERLLGIARLLSQMAEPVMKAAMSFFIDLCAAVLALLARVRVLIQQSFVVDTDPLVIVSQMLLDVVSVYNRVTALTDRKQAVKISISGVQAFREYYPSIHDDRTILECVWVKDKFVLHEKMKEAFFVNCIAIFVAKFSEMKTVEETNSPRKQPDIVLVEHPDKVNNCSDAGASSTGRQLENENNAACSLDTLSTPASSFTRLDIKPVTKKRVAFIAVGKPKVTATPSETKLSEVNKKQRLDVVPRTAVESGELFRKLQDSDNANNSLF